VNQWANRLIRQQIQGNSRAAVGKISTLPIFDPSSSQTCVALHFISILSQSIVLIIHLLPVSSLITAGTQRFNAILLNVEKTGKHL
jgi:hypothetical protein